MYDLVIKEFKVCSLFYGRTFSIIAKTSANGTSFRILMIFLRV